MAIFRINLKDGSEEQIEMCQVRQGDVFYTVDGGVEGKGPLLQADADADQRPHHKIAGRLVWGCKAGFASLEVRLDIAALDLHPHTNKPRVGASLGNESLAEEIIDHNGVPLVADPFKFMGEGTS